MVDLMYYLTNLSFFDIPLLCYYINLEWWIICCLFGRYASFVWHFSIKSYIFCFTFKCFWTILWWTSWYFVVTSAILLPAKSTVASAFFWIALFEAVLSASVTDCSTCSRSFWLYLLLKFLIVIFLPIFFPYF